MQKHSLIIGGTSGMGRALVSALAEEKHKVSVIGIRPAPEADQRIPNVHYWIVDLLDRERLSEALAEITGQYGKLNNLVFFQRYRGEGDDWTGEIETTLTATKFVIDCLVDEFDDAGENSIVITSSIADHLVAEEQPLSYHVAKGGLNQIVRYYAVTLGSKGIRVNSVSPGTIMKEEAREFYLQNEQLLDLYKRIIPLGRMGTSEDVAQVIAFLCSPKAAYITGQNIIIDGGLSLQWQESLARKQSPASHLKITRESGRS